MKVRLQVDIWLGGLLGLTLTIVEIIDDIWNNKDRDYNTRFLMKRLRRIEKEMSADARDLFAAYIPAGTDGTETEACDYRKTASPKISCRERAGCYHKALADIISMVKHAAEEQQPLLTAPERVERAMSPITQGQHFTLEQRGWLERIRAHTKPVDWSRGLRRHSGLLS